MNPKTKKPSPVKLKVGTGAGSKPPVKLEGGTGAVSKLSEAEQEEFIASGLVTSVML